MGSGVVALSGAASVETNAPFVLWLDKTIRHLHPDHATLVGATTCLRSCAINGASGFPSMD